MLPLLGLTAAFVAGLVGATVWYWLACGRPPRYRTLAAQFAADCRARTRDRELSRLAFPLLFLVLTAGLTGLYSGSTLQGGGVALVLLPVMLAIVVARTGDAAGNDR